MVIEIPIPNWITKTIWFLQGRCDNCGGEMEEHINGKWYCKDCGKKE